jgi:hypothetical protein
MNRRDAQMGGGFAKEARRTVARAIAGSAHRCSMCRVRKSGAAKVWREVLPPFPGRFLQPAIGHCTLASLVTLRTHKCLVVPFNLFRDVRCSLLLAAGTHEQPCGIRRTCAALTALPGHRAAVAELLTVPQRAQHATQHVGPDHGARHTMAHGNLHEPWHCSIAHGIQQGTARCTWYVPGNTKRVLMGTHTGTSGTRTTIVPGGPAAVLSVAGRS